MNRKQYVHENVVHNFMKDEDGNVINTIQNYVDLAAMGLEFVPVVGTVAGNVLDAGSALVDVAQGEYGDAGIRALQAVPGLGAAALATKLGAKGIGKMTGKALTSTPSKVATSASGVVSGAVGAVKDSLSGEKEGEEGVDKTAAQTAAQAASDSQELVRNFAASQLLGNKRIIKHGTLQTFESVSSDITRCLLEKTIKDKVGTKIIDGMPFKYRLKPKPKQKPDTPDTKDKQPGYLSRFLTPGIAASAVLASAFGLPMAVGKLYGSDTSAPAGQGPGSQGDGDVPAQGGVSTVLDRLSAVSGFIPGFNPAGAALGALGRRVGT